MRPVPPICQLRRWSMLIPFVSSVTPCGTAPAGPDSFAVARASCVIIGCWPTTSSSACPPSGSMLPRRAALVVAPAQQAHSYSIPEPLGNANLLQRLPMYGLSAARCSAAAHPGAEGTATLLDETP